MTLAVLIFSPRTHGNPEIRWLLRKGRSCTTSHSHFSDSIPLTRNHKARVPLPVVTGHFTSWIVICSTPSEEVLGCFGYNFTMFLYQKHGTPLNVQITGAHWCSPWMFTGEDHRFDLLDQCLQHFLAIHSWFFALNREHGWTFKITVTYSHIVT